MTDEQTPEEQPDDPIAETIEITVADRISALQECGQQTVAFLASALESTARQEYGDLLRRAEVAALQTSALAAVEQAAALHRIADALEFTATIEPVTHVTINEVTMPADEAATLPPVVTGQEPDEQPATIEPQPEEAPPADAPIVDSPDVPPADGDVAPEPQDAPAVPSDAPDVASEAADVLDEPVHVTDARDEAEIRLAAQHEHDVAVETAASTPSDGATPDVPKKTRTRKPSA